MKTPTQSIRNFVLLELASFMGILGGSMVFMLLPWTAINLTHSSMAAGLLISLSNIPQLLTSPVLGSIIDKFGRRKSGIFMQMAPMLTSIAFPLSQNFGEMTVATLATLAVARGLVSNGAMSARKSLLPDTIAGTKITLERANGLHESIAAGGFAIGPAVASVLIGVLGTFNTFFVVAGFEALAASILVFVKVHEHYELQPIGEEQRHWIHYLLRGFKTVGSIPAVLILMLTFTVLSTVYLPTEMVVLPNYYAAMHDAKTMGFLLFDMAIFTMLGSFAFEALSKRVSFAVIMRGAIIAVAVAMVPMCFFPATWVMFTAGAVLGLAWGPLPPLVNTVVQRKVPASERGRVFSLENTIWSGGPMISMGLVGWGVDALGVHTMYPIIAGLVLLAAIILSTRKSVKDLNTAEYSDGMQPVVGPDYSPPNAG